MTHDISVSATPDGAPVSTTTPIDSTPAKATEGHVAIAPGVEAPKGAGQTFDDFDENQIPESSRDNFRKYREAQSRKYAEAQEKINAETRRRIEFETRASQYEERLRAAQNPLVNVGEKPDYKAFSTIEDYSAALEKWAKASAGSEYTKQQQQQQQQRAIEQENAKMVQRGQAARAKYADFDNVVRPILPLADRIPAITQFIREFDNGTDVLYQLGKNPAVLEALATMPPFAAGQELLRIQAALGTPAPKVVSQAPAPINPVNTGGDGTVKSVLELVKSEKLDDYVDRENRKELRRRKGNE